MFHFLKKVLALRTALLLALLPAAGCHGLLIERPKSDQVNAAYTAHWVTEIEANGQDGDIVLRRGYALLSDVIELTTPGEPLSHAGIYDAERHTVIEAIDPVVSETPIESFVNGSHRVVLLRPTGLSREERRQVLERAREQLGVKFDYGGFVGVDDPDRFYCSELAVWAIAAEERGLPIPQPVVAPSQLMQYGVVLFDSGPREERGPAPRQELARR